MSEITLERINAWFTDDLPRDKWTILYKDYDPVKERTREALTSVGNGYFATRGC
jgi:trehalose/maltose hydrolase-like predicted phosphorylase